MMILCKKCEIFEFIEMDFLNLSSASFDYISYQYTVSGERGPVVLERTSIMSVASVN